MKLGMGMLLAAMSIQGCSDFSNFRQNEFCSFSGRHQKKQNKLSQSAKRKRNRQRGIKK